MNTRANRPPVMNPARGDKRRGRGRGSGLCTPARRGAGRVSPARRWGDNGAWPGAIRNAPQ